MLTNWTAAGLPPADFWEVTPRLHAAIMKGRERALIRELEVGTFIAWQVARLTTYGGKKLPALPDLLKALRAEPAKPQTAADMIAALRAVKERLARRPSG